MRIFANDDSAIIEIALQPRFVLARYIRVSYSNRQGDIYPAGIKVKVLVATNAREYRVRFIIPRTHE